MYKVLHIKRNSNRGTLLIFNNEQLITYSLEYLRRIAGPRTVPVELGSRYTDEDWSQKLMTLSDFIDQHVLREVTAVTCFVPCSLCN